MPATTPERHHDISAMFMEHAEDQFRQGDLLQASEKAWGAVAHCISAIARERGWAVGTHRHLITHAEKLIARDAAQAERRHRQWDAVELLHINFYQEIRSENQVRRGIEDAKELIEAFRELADRPDTPKLP